MKKHNRLIIIGASGHGRKVVNAALKRNDWNEISFLDDNLNIKSVMGLSVIGKLDEIYKYINDYDFFVAIGNYKIRESLQNQLEELGANIVNIVHPSAIIGEQVSIGKGTVVMENVVITCCCKIGKGCIINTSATISHDDLIEDFVHISIGAHLAGTVKIGKGTFLGIGSIVINNMMITDNCIIGAGSVVTKDILESGTYVGIPAKKIK